MIKIEIKKRRVLLIEDDRLDQMAFERFLKSEKDPYDYRIAGSIAEARKILGTEKFDVIITDYQLRDGVAMEILDLKPNIPIIMTTGTGNEEIAVRALKAGAFDYLIKDPDRYYLKILPATVELALKHWENERQIAMLSLAVRSVQDSIYITDREGRMIFVNQSFCQTYGYTEGEILGESSGILWGGSPPSSQSTYEGEFLHRRKTGSGFPVFLSSSILKDDAGKEIALVSIARDITEFKKAEQILLQKTEELARSKAELEQLKIFAFVTSHDLQEPLHKIVTFGDLLVHSAGSSLNEKSRENLETMQDAAKRLSQMIEQLRNLSEIATKPSSDEGVDLNKLVEETLKNSEESIKKSAARIEIQPLPKIKGNRFQIQQLFKNLIENALKFRQEGKPLEIHIKGKEMGARFVEITVEDNGIGFEDKFAEQIFVPFHRLHAKHEYPGSGIGLAICRNVVQRHGGQIMARSQVGKGSTFIFTLPRV